MSVVTSLLHSHVIPHNAATAQSRSFLALFKQKVTKMHLQTSPSLSTYTYGCKTWERLRVFTEFYSGMLRRIDPDIPVLVTICQR